MALWLGVRLRRSRSAELQSLSWRLEDDMHERGRDSVARPPVGNVCVQRIWGRVEFWVLRTVHAKACRRDAVCCQCVRGGRM